MDIYQIFLTHNRPWSMRELLYFGIVTVVAATILGRCVQHKKIKKTQAVSLFGLLIFLGIVFGSTVFTREPTVRSYELVPLWSWREVVVSHDWELLQENLLNCILLFPMGMLLPLVFEWDDMIHNGLGCMAGSLCMNLLLKKWRKGKWKK